MIGCEECRAFGSAGFVVAWDGGRASSRPCGCVVREWPSTSYVRAGKWSEEPRPEVGPDAIYRTARSVAGILNRAGIPQEYQGRTYESWRTEFPALVDPVDRLLFEGECVRSKDAVREWHRGVISGTEPRGLYLWGPVGDGKSLGAAIVLQAQIGLSHESGAFVRLTGGFLGRLRATFDDKGRAAESRTYAGPVESEEDVWREMTGNRLLVLDDADKGMTEDRTWRGEALFRLVDELYQARRRLIVTANRSPWEAFGWIESGAVADRLAHMCRVVEMPGRSIRELVPYGI